MYEQISHALLNEILDELKPEIRRQNLRHFYTRLGANFYAIHSLFHHLYGNRDDFKPQMVKLVEVMASRYIERNSELEQRDIERQKNHNWFLSQELVGMAVYADGFAGNLEGVCQHTAYFQELGINMVHIMPMMVCPEGRSDGGYAVSDFRNIDPRIGSLEDLATLTADLRRRDILLALDVVVNHTSNEHPWAQRAQQGDTTYQEYFYTFPNRDIPDMFEESMPEVFPHTAPQNFTWDETMQRWVMTVFNNYQWDLNYSNPSVFIEMIDIILFWANQGADIVRLDAVAFLWKKIGTSCQNEHEAHLILQLMKDCCQVPAPGLLFIAEAIVAPTEIIRYFGEDAIIAKECEIAYNATFMALLWDSVATHNAKLLNQGIRSLPNKLDRATWLNYIRCHDDIGFGFDDRDISACGYNPYEHRQFLINYFSGAHQNSIARGQPFGFNPKTGDARISGSLASLIGLERALELNDEKMIDIAITRILLMHGMILSFGGIPLLYYGDEIGTLNDCTYLEDERKANDNRWMHRPRIDWEKAARRQQPGTVEQRIFFALKKMIAIRKTIPAFADFNNRELISVDNPHLFVFLRTHPLQSDASVLVVANFDAKPQHLNMNNLGQRRVFKYGTARDLHSGAAPAIFKDELVISPYRFYWLADGRPEIRF
ncbi:MAG: alpha-glucosidase C-terminal domain-containing protein [Gammaproteobacteria bacterium]|nr:alpha-glucosidase C-terminal domain-containing protein [Gammaproteobacteria bacterium]